MNNSDQGEQLYNIKIGLAAMAMLTKEFFACGISFIPFVVVGGISGATVFGMGGAAASLGLALPVGIVVGALIGATCGIALWLMGVVGYKLYKALKEGIVNYMEASDRAIYEHRKRYSKIFRGLYLEAYQEARENDQELNPDKAKKLYRKKVNSVINEVDNQVLSAESSTSKERDEYKEYIKNIGSKVLLSEHYKKKNRGNINNRKIKKDSYKEKIQNYEENNKDFLISSIPKFTKWANTVAAKVRSNNKISGVIDTFCFWASKPVTEIKKDYVLETRRQIRPLHV